MDYSLIDVHPVENTGRLIPDTPFAQNRLGIQYELGLPVLGGPAMPRV